MLRQPTSTAPARRSPATAAASCSADGRSRLIREPASVVTPATSNRFFTAKGTPARGPASPPPAITRSIRSASASARSPRRVVKQLRVGSRLAIRSSAAATTARAEPRRAATAPAISSAEAPSSRTLIGSWTEDRRGLDVAGQGKLHEQPRRGQETGQDLGDGGTALGLDREPDERGALLDVRLAHARLRAATYARQPPYSVISRWPSQSTGSPSTPSVSSPSARRTLPTQRPCGSASKTAASPAAGTVHTSTAIAAPPCDVRTIAG